MNQRAEAPNGNKYGLLDGTSHVTVIPAPSDAFTGSGPYYRVGTVAVFNADNAGVVVNVYINNGSGTRTQIDSQLLDASPPTTVDDICTYTSADRFPHGILVRGPEFVEVNLGSAASPAPTYYATWAEVRGDS